MLAIVSKNNPDDVGHVLASHPSMQLRDEDFVAKKVGWGEKIVGLRELADELCLGLDSFVFLDDFKRSSSNASRRRCLRSPR